jgi:ABC-type branched-subunit amino acid transport system ATPase component/branched-subunit amino acid ABC-type transport system permease component
MTEFWQFLLLGLGLCPAYALVAQSIVVVYRGSTVVNFASAGFAVLGGYAYYGLERVGLPPGVALIGGLLAGALCGVVTDVLIMRRLANAPQLTRVIATLGIASIILIAISLATGNSESPIPVAVFGNSRLVILGGIASTYNLVIFALSIVMTAVLWAVYRWTPFGLRTAAVAENRRSAAALGIVPELIGVANWALGGAIAALGGVLVSPILSLSISSASLLIAPALAAALLGRFVSFWLSLLGALVIAIGESELTHYSTVWNIGSGWQDVAPFLVVIAVLAVRGTSLPGRSDMTDRLPGLGSGRVRPGLVAVVALAGCLVISLLPTAGAGAVTTTASTGIILLSFVVVTGYAGQISLAQAGLAGLGAFIGARLGVALGLSFWLSLLVGVAGTLPIGALVGLPAIRARGVNLAIVTLGLGLIIQDVLLGNAKYVGGLGGIQTPNASIFGYALDGFDHPGRYATLCFLAFVIVGLIIANLRRSRVGRQLVAVRGNERAAASLGINVVASKLYAFVVGSGVAALGGMLLAFQSPFVIFQGFDTNTSITMLTFVVVGGLGYFGASLFGGMLAGAGVAAWAIGLIITSAQITNWLSLLGGVAVIATVIAQPDGLSARTAERWGPRLDRLTPRWRRRAREVAVVTRSPSPHCALAVKDISVRFGGVVALDNVSFTVSSGEVVGLIGPNGAGKTTMIDTITGLNNGYEGTVTVDGRPMDGWSPAKRARSGIVRSFQSLELFADLSVQDNLRVAADLPRRRNYITDLIKPGRDTLPSSALAAIEQFELTDYLTSLPTELPYGQRRLVAIARAVAASEARILLLDEPAAGLDEHSSRELAAMLRTLATEWNFGILLVEHDMGLVMSACDRIVALDFGHVIADGPTDQVRRDPVVVSAYLGELPADGLEPAVGDLQEQA